MFARDALLWCKFVHGRCRIEGSLKFDRVSRLDISALCALPLLDNSQSERLVALCLHPWLHLFRRHFLLERRNGPHIPEWILKSWSSPPLRSPESELYGEFLAIAYFGSPVLGLHRLKQSFQGIAPNGRLRWRRYPTLCSAR